MEAEVRRPESSACRVTLSDFEGPLDLLLYLIRRDELDVTMVQMAQVAGQYLEYIRTAEELDIDVAGEYLVMAATLTRLKSLSLLPSRRESADDPDDPGKALLRQLILYRAFREAAAELRDSEETWRDAFPPSGERHRYQETAREPAGRDTGSLLDLLEALESLAQKDRPPTPHLVERSAMSIAECIERISRALPGGSGGSFREILGEKPGIHLVVSYFVALLELVRRGWVSCRQDGPFGGIALERTASWE